VEAETANTDTKTLKEVYIKLSALVSQKKLSALRSAIMGKKIIRLKCGIIIALEKQHATKPSHAVSLG